MQRQSEVTNDDDEEEEVEEKGLSVRLEMK